MDYRELRQLKRGTLFWFSSHAYAYRFIGVGERYMTVESTHDGSRRRIRYNSNMVTLMSRTPYVGQIIGQHNPMLTRPRKVKISHTASVKRRVRVGPKGGRYYLRRGRKVYV